jgi:hypothetical protein
MELLAAGLPLLAGGISAGGEIHFDRDLTPEEVCWRRRLLLRTTRRCTACIPSTST